MVPRGHGNTEKKFDYSKWHFLFWLAKICKGLA